ncbi:MAG: hypothetical protein ITG00_06025 [Flavobacterium sp.]|nr:hypothetical protein [Flavobacterium sp.]
MINPSATGWIVKFFISQPPPVEIRSLSDFYSGLRETGFIYGHVVSLNVTKPIITKGWQADEYSKVALLKTLYQVFVNSGKRDSAQFIAEAVSFYNQMNPKGFDLFEKMLPANSAAVNLERIIDARVRTNDNFISKNFSHIVTNALLFMDVLAFQKYLTHGSIPEKYLKRLEEIIISVVSLALKTKSSKSVHDSLLIKMFEASVRYSKFSKVSLLDSDTSHVNNITEELEKLYLLDLAAMAMYSDGTVEKAESDFLQTLGIELQISSQAVADSIEATNRFILKYRDTIPYFHYSNPVKHFYDRMTQSVVVLITRNKSRLIQEIRQSRDLMVLLAQSARRDLNEKEKKKVKKQLLEICKTIPSLTIFLLPGGSLLLPILIKFIPQLLPSAFNENNSLE